jgi:hypothetical protein
MSLSVKTAKFPEPLHCNFDHPSFGEIVLEMIG